MASINYNKHEEEYDETLSVLIGPEEARLVEESREEAREKYGDDYNLIGERAEVDEEFDYETEFETPSNLEEVTAHLVAGSITTGFRTLEIAGQTAFSTLEAIAKALD